MEKFQNERDQRRYEELVAQYKANPGSWFRCNDAKGIVFDGIVTVWINQFEFRTGFTPDAIARFYQFPKSEYVAHVLYGKKEPYGFAEKDWLWNARLYVRDGALAVYDLRGLTKSLNSIFKKEEWEKKREVSAAIAAESPKGEYIVEINDFRYYQKNGERRFLLNYEVLSGQARGYQGALFFDPKSAWHVERLRKIERVLGLDAGFWDEVQKNRDSFTWKEPRKLKGLYLKARLDFKGEFVKFENPRKVDNTEVDLWM